MAKNIYNDLVSELKDINPFAEILNQDSVFEIKDYISTGSLILNAVISGDCNKGVPAGRITTLCGLSGTGKSLIAGLIAANAQRKDYDVIWFDSEFASDKTTFEKLGVDASKMIKIPVATIEQFKIQIFKIVELYETKYAGRKVCIVLDSLGNLASQKDLDDATEGKNAADMGLRGKMIRSVFRILTDKIGKLKIPVILINHTYLNPGNPYAPETMSGGEGPRFISHIILHLKNSKVKDEDKNITGTLLKVTTTKNRLIPPFKTAQILLDFNKGIDKYHGFLDIAVELGIVKKEGKRFKTIKDETLRWEKDMSDAKVWEPIIEEVNKAYSESNTYSSLNVSSEEMKGL